MKAVIVEICGSRAAALSDDGIFRQVKNRRYSVGQEIVLKATRRNTVLIRGTACAAAVMIMLCTTAWAYYSPYSYVSLDVNPSIEYTVNRFDRVLDCSAVNGDGAVIVDDLRLRHKHIQDALSKTIEKLANKGFLAGEQNSIVIAASSRSDQKVRALVDKMKEAVEEEAAKEHLDVSLEAVGVSRESVQQAKKLGVTPGKLVLVDKLQDSGTNLTDEDLEKWLHSPVKDIMKQIQENKKEEAVSQKAQGNDHSKSSKTANANNGSFGTMNKSSDNPEENTVDVERKMPGKKVEKDAKWGNESNDENGHMKDKEAN